MTIPAIRICNRKGWLWFRCGRIMQLKDDGAGNMRLVCSCGNSIPIGRMPEPVKIPYSRAR